MWRAVMLCALLSTLAGCAMKWQRADTTPQQLAQDEYACAMEVNEQTGMPIFVGSGASGAAMGHGFYRRSLYKACMRARGYTEE